ncbi:MAG: hypothetical protein M3O32_01935 [Actinomycetota bacterium]|nr:hypothetical protein [Actinomycetota bacterium]
MATAALAGGLAVVGSGAAYADTRVSPSVVVDALNGSSCFDVTLANATFYADGTPKSVSGGSVSFAQPVLYCIPEINWEGSGAISTSRHN